jgi:mono/diheme cytochrome c family protein
MMGHERLGIIAAVVGFGVVLATTGIAQAADGAALWDKHCASCHGKDGKGDTKAGKLTKVRDLTAADLRSTLTRDHVRQATEQGVVDKASGKTRMKGYKDKLSSDELDALTSHVLGFTGATQ